MRDILRADELKQAKDKYESWLKLSAEEKQAAYAAVASAAGGKRVVRATRLVYIHPFGISSSKFVYSTKALHPESPDVKDAEKQDKDTAVTTKVTTLVANYLFTSLPVGCMSNEAKKIQFAKCRVTRIIGEPKGGATSRLTGRKYTKVNTNTLSSPFGSPLAKMTESAAVSAIMGAFDKTDKTVKIGFSAQGKMDIQEAASVTS